MDTPRERARELRHDQTDAERKLWNRLRDRQLSGAKFRRQHPIGPFVGGQHAARVEADLRRTAYLRQQGNRVLRFWDNDVLQNMEGVLACIGEALDPHPNPLPKRERE